MDVPTAVIESDATVLQAPWRFLLRCALLAAGGLSLTLALLLLVRGWLGFLEPLAAGSLLIMGLAGGCLARMWHEAWQILQPRVPARAAATTRWIDALPALALGALALALSFTANGAGVLLLWLPLVLAEATWWAAPGWRARRASAAELPNMRARSSPIERESEDEQILQRTTRFACEGVEQFVGEYRCRFQPRERTQIVHVVFCPPFSAVPELSITQLEGPPAQIKAAQAQCYGVRLEVRLSNAQPEPAEVYLELIARPLSAP